MNTSTVRDPLVIWSFLMHLYIYLIASVDNLQDLG